MSDESTNSFMGNRKRCNVRVGTRLELQQTAGGQQEGAGVLQLGVSQEFLLKGLRYGKALK
jgi:hypothetical protein